jgi:hypothetical protein
MYCLPDHPFCAIKSKNIKMKFRLWQQLKRSINISAFHEGDENMIGFPKHLNSKADYLYVKANFASDQWKPVWQSLLDDQQQWFNIGVITGPGTTDTTRKVVTNPAMGDQAAVSYQYELQNDPNCTLLQLGFTVAEVQAALA